MGGIILGCILGMVPLLFMTDRNSDAYRLRVIFDQIDTDQSGFIEEHELAVAILRFGMAKDEAQAGRVAAKLLETMDVGVENVEGKSGRAQDGHVSYDEFVAAVGRYKNTQLTLEARFD